MFVLLTFVAKILSKQTNNNIVTFFFKLRIMIRLNIEGKRLFFIKQHIFSMTQFHRTITCIIFLSSQSDLYKDQFISVKIIWLDWSRICPSRVVVPVTQVVKSANSLWLIGSMKRKQKSNDKKRDALLNTLKRCVVSTVLRKKKNNIAIFIHA